MPVIPNQSRFHSLSRFQTHSFSKGDLFFLKNQLLRNSINLDHFEIASELNHSSIYTGGLGYAYYLYACSQLPNPQSVFHKPTTKSQLLTNALEIMLKNKPRMKYPSFLSGYSGYYSLLIMIYLAFDQVEKCLEQFDIWIKCLAKPNHFPESEILYGTAGSLWGLLWVYKSFKVHPSIPSNILSSFEKLIRKSTIFQLKLGKTHFMACSGHETSPVQHHSRLESTASSSLYDSESQGSSSSPSKFDHGSTEVTPPPNHIFCPMPDRQILKYTWMKKQFYGAAHGTAGILYVLLKSYNIDHQVPFFPLSCLKYIFNTILHVCSIQFPSGNIPSSFSKLDDNRLVQWCHGAPGWIFTLIEAEKTLEMLKNTSCFQNPTINDNVSPTKQSAYSHSLLSEDYIKSTLSKIQKCLVSCAEATFAFGFLTKSISICHGTMGNALALIAFALHKNSLQYLEKVFSMIYSVYCSKYKVVTNPEHPFALYTGLLGTHGFARVAALQLVDLFQITISTFGKTNQPTPKSLTQAPPMNSAHPPKPPNPTNPTNDSPIKNQSKKSLLGFQKAQSFFAQHPEFLFPGFYLG